MNLARGQPEQASAGRTGKRTDIGRVRWRRPGAWERTEWRPTPAAPRWTKKNTDTLDWQKLRRGWLHGAAEFRERILAQAHGQASESHAASHRQETSEAHAQRIVREELRRRGWNEAELRRRAKGDAQKVQIARRLRQESTMSLKWIAARLEMGTWTHVSNRLSQQEEQVCVNTKD